MDNVCTQSQDYISTLEMRRRVSLKRTASEDSQMNRIVIQIILELRVSKVEHVNINRQSGWTSVLHT